SSTDEVPHDCPPATAAPPAWSPPTRSRGTHRDPQDAEPRARPSAPPPLDNHRTRSPPAAPAAATRDQTAPQLPATPPSATPDRPAAPRAAREPRSAEFPPSAAAASAAPASTTAGALQEVQIAWSIPFRLCIREERGMGG